MGTYEEKAKNLFLEGYNCSQAVLDRKSVV